MSPRLPLLALLLLGCRQSTPAPSPVQGSAGQTAPPDCVFSSFNRSTLAWESGLAQGIGPATPAGGGDLVGRVFALRDGTPVVGARVHVAPGARGAVTDSAGRFAIRGLVQGRYYVRVSPPLTMGTSSAEDSVTVGFDGLRVIAALAGYRGDIVCTGHARQPSNER
jgi:hypothetical protein